MNEDHASKIADKFYREVRNKVLADIYYHFKNRTVSGAELARLFGLHRQEITNLVNRYYPSKDNEPEL